METNSSRTKDAEFSGNDSDNNYIKNPLKQAAIKTFSKIIPKKRKLGRPPKPRDPEFSPNYDKQYLESPARK